MAVANARLTPRKRRWSWAISLLSWVVAAHLMMLPATAEPLAQTATAEQIRAVHTGSSQKAWKLVYRTQDQSPIEFVVWQDYATLKMDDKSTIFDFKLKRLIRLGEDGDRFFHSSMYASVGFRDLEFHNRVQLTKFLEGTNEPVEDAQIIADPFWRAS